METEEERNPLLITLSEKTRELLFTFAGSRKRSYTVETAIQSYIRKEDPKLAKRILGNEKKRKSPVKKKVGENK